MSGIFAAIIIMTGTPRGHFISPVREIIRPTSVWVTLSIVGRHQQRERGGLDFESGGQQSHVFAVDLHVSLAREIDTARAAGMDALHGLHPPDSDAEHV